MRNKYAPYIALVLALIVGWNLWFSGVKEEVREGVKQEIELKTLEKNEVIRKEVKDAVQQNKKSNPTSDPNIALERLLKRQLAQ